MAQDPSLRAPDAGGDGDDLRVVASAGDGVRGDERRRGGVDRGHSQYRSAAGDVGVRCAHRVWLECPKVGARISIFSARRDEFSVHGNAADQNVRLCKTLDLCGRRGGDLLCLRLSGRIASVLYRGA